MRLGEKSPFLTHIIPHWQKNKMKRISFYDLFLFAALFIAMAADWSIYSCVLLICAAVLELVDVIPQIVRWFRAKR